MKKALDSFWNDSATAVQPVERRILFTHARKHGQLRVSIVPDQPVPDAASLSEQMLEAAVIEPVMLGHGIISPQLIFGHARHGSHAKQLVIATPSGRELPVVQSVRPLQSAKEVLTFEQQMKQSEAALPPAQLAEGDHAVGFIYRDHVLHFYPLVTVNLPEDVASYREGAGTTSDLIPLLPFQS